MIKLIASQTILQIVPGPPAPSPFWGPLIASAAVLLIASGLALRRSTGPPPVFALRRTRIFWSAVACAGGLVLIRLTDVAWDAFRAGPDLFGTGLLFLIVFLVAAGLFGAADLLLDFFDPRRTVPWLITGVIIFPTYILGLLMASAWIHWIWSRGDVRDLFMTVPMFAASLTWWSFLPVPSRPIEGVFE